MARGRCLIGIVGAGALGTLFAAALARAGFSVAVLVRTSDSAQAIEARGGVALEGHAGTLRCATADPAALKRAAVILVAVKTYATVAALMPLREMLSPSTPLVSLQNGLDAPERIAGALGPHVRVALGVTTEAATLLHPGLARRTARGTTILGWPATSPSDDAALPRLAEILRTADLSSTLAENIEPYVWGKLVVNAAINPLSALAGVRNGALLEDPSLRRRAGTLAREAAAVAAACGIRLPFLDPVSAVEDVVRATAANRSSMLQDFDAGRPTEIDAINGALVRRAHYVGIAVPQNARIADEVRARTKA